MNSSEFCKFFYASHYLPIAYYDQTGFITSVGFLKPEDPYLFVLPKLISQKQPAVYVSSDTGCYGMVKAMNGYFIIGPAYGITINDSIVHAFMNKNAIPISQKAEVTQFLHGLPQYSYNHFLNLLLFLHFTLTGESLSVADAFDFGNLQSEKLIGRKHAELSLTNHDEGIVHGTYLFERHMLDLVRRGAVNEVEKFLLSSAQTRPLTEGNLADTPLRQAKNVFIGLATMIGKGAAIPGGMDTEEAYQLIDTYIQECERIQSVETITSLQFNMIKDFTYRVSKHRLPPGISAEVQSCIQFIALHVNESLTLADVAAYIGKSRAYTCNKFKAETNISIGQYITLCKLREAQTLLQYTNKSLSEISAYLAFSSQPYFQSVFKKNLGCTPLEYRNRQKLPPTQALS